ncbi:MAG: amidohydrolase [Dehalococcoidales bacterium]|nr:amidohydrolase [Dehalococcoidales bacterium]
MPTAAPSPFAPTDADLVLVNGKVITVDLKDSIAQAVAVKNGKIIKVGSNDEVKALIGQQTKVLDLKGRTVTPGLVDSHTHVYVWGNQFWPGFLDTRLPNASSKAKLLQLVGEKAKVAPKGEWISGNQGFSLSLKATPDRWALDSVSPDNPVYLRHLGGQYAVVNSYALRLAGINKNTQNPYGGRIEKDPDSGEPTGRLFHYSAENLVGRLAPGYGVNTAEKRIEDVKRGQDLDLAAGYTSGQDVIAANTAIVNTYRWVESHNALKMRIYVMQYVASEEDGKNLLRDVQPFKSEMLTFGGWKLAVDGGPGAGTALMYDQSLQAAKNSYEYWDQQTLNRMVGTFHKAGFQVSFHAQGDKAIDMAINAVEAALKETPRENSRFRIEHASFPTPQALERIKKLGIVISTQPQWITAWGDEFRSAVDEKTMQRMMPIRTMMEMGIHLAFGCDVPATPVLEPKYAFIGAVTRTTTSGYTTAPQECISIKDALRIHTMGSAYASFEENIKGSIEVGKLADMVVWSHDLYSMPVSQLMDLKAEVTIVGGKIVYEEK